MSQPAEGILNTLRRLMALTQSSNEHESALAAERMHALLAKHNLGVADLEKRGQTTPGVRQEGFDLGKAAFKWKLNLAETVARHYFCWPLVDHQRKTVAFVGRPDNVESLTMLYGWIIDQIKRISADERRVWQVENNEHVDPLRWQVNFGLGAVERLAVRLKEMTEQQSADVQAIVVHHQAEISDYLETQFGYRVDGQMTQAQREREERWRKAEEARKLAREERQAYLDHLKATDIELYYIECPWDRPKTDAELAKIKADQAKQAAADERRWAAQDRRAARNAARRKGPQTRYVSDAEWRRMQQAENAQATGRVAADKVNLRPFLGEGDKAPTSKGLK